jgi:hypothetical protein
MSGVIEGTQLHPIGTQLGAGSGGAGGQLSGSMPSLQNTCAGSLAEPAVLESCFCALQTRVWSGWYPILPEQHPAPPPALGQCGRLASLLPCRGCRLTTGLPDPGGCFAGHPDGPQSAGPSAPGAKWDLGLASEAAFAQVLPCL